MDGVENIELKDIKIASQFDIIKTKLIKNIIKFNFNPLKFKQYIKNIVRLLSTKSKLSSYEKKNTKELLKKSINLIDQNELIIKSYFKTSNENLNLKINLKNQYKYFF